MELAMGWLNVQVRLARKQETPKIPYPTGNTFELILTYIERMPKRQLTRLLNLKLLSRVFDFTCEFY